MLEQPTAPLLEHLVKAYIREVVRGRPALYLAEDGAGNVLVATHGPEIPPDLVFVAHLDHPAFVVEWVHQDAVRLIFRGWALAGHVRPGQALRFHSVGQTAPTGRGRLVDVDAADARVAGGTAQLTAGAAIAGGFAMWDVPGFDRVGDLIAACCCDDLLGAAAILCMLDELAAAPPSVAVAGLFTRGESVGFLGTLEAIRRRTVARTAAIVAVDCSKALPGTTQGAGPIVRVGDVRSVFHAGVTEGLREVAEGLRVADSAFRYQRKLMDGGTCEATPFCVAGYRASALALALDGLGNMVTDDGGVMVVGSETVHVDDFVGLVRLLVELAHHAQVLTRRPRRPPWLSRFAKQARAELGPEALGSVAP